MSKKHTGGSSKKHTGASTTSKAKAGRKPKKKCCVSKPRCSRCPLRMLAEGTLPEGYTVKKRKLVTLDGGAPVHQVKPKHKGKSKHKNKGKHKKNKQAHKDKRAA